MDGADEARSLAGLLCELKNRAGVSYAALARATFTTSSSLHRYCRGESVPRDYAVVAALAKECGATPHELTELLRLWTAATAGPQDASATAPGQEPAAAQKRPAPARPAAGPQRPGARVLAGAAVCLVMLLLLSSAGAPTRSASPGAPAAPSTRAASAGPGDRWTWAPYPVAPSVFGVTMNSNTGTMPSFRVGSVRFWDSGTRWADLEPLRGTFDWANLDRLVAAAQRTHLDSLFTFGGTPSWAAPRGHKSLYHDGARTAPPDRLADWDAFVAALAARYRGRISAYELWDTVNDRHFYSGSVHTMADMVRRASRIIKRTDPDALLVCPSMGHLHEAAGLRFLRDFATADGYQTCDVGGVKTLQRPAERPPETLTTELAGVNRVLHNAGAGVRLWITGPDFDVTYQPGLTGRAARDYAVRFFLMALYAMDQGVQRAYFYNWGGTKIPVVLQVEGEPPSPAALAVDRLQRWLAGARIHGCGHGSAAGLPGNVYTCTFLGPGRGEPFAIRWTDTGTAAMPAGPGAHRLYRLDGSATRLTPGAWLCLTGAPVLINGATA
ncbi:helix-turn-helix domain-containing protein [Streptomyces sioyaensis]|uniref:helix-turn-helix domain-containing protein n=1 Tax=Streptomyces sioyaensis TaxID=67364 RepID=UPI003797B4AA